MRTSATYIAPVNIDESRVQARTKAHSERGTLNLRGNLTLLTFPTFQHHPRSPTLHLLYMLGGGRPRRASTAHIIVGH
jgi:hypothetical protein